MTHPGPQTAQLDAPPAGARILHVVQDTGDAQGSLSPVAELAGIAIGAQREARLAAGVAGTSRIVEAVLAQAGTPEEEVLRLEAPIGGQPSPADPRSAFTLHRAYPFTDIVHAHGLGAGVIAALGMTGLPRRLRPALVVTLGRDSGESGSSVLDRSGQALIAKHADVLLGSTAGITEAFADQVPITRRAPLLRPEDPPAPLVPRKDRSTVRRELGLGEDTWLIAAPIALQDSTALTTIVDASRLVGKGRVGRSAVLALTGTGSERSTIAREFATRRDFSLVLPEPADQPSVLAAADVVIASERMSGVDGDALLQLGRPAIGIGTRKLGALLGDELVLVPEDDTDALVKAVHLLLDDPIARGRMGHAAKRRVSASNPAQTAVAELLDAYAAALRNRRAGR
ncbi:group 1 glycosyl transferase [Sediminivirga luteola]|uniref:group 1 glycosyl transferase n=1 Tax=Sediminivirga luteola TaxID=1774748 RepID=UPI001F5AE0BA|nr:group 1 glycosyl transferase [Sediminivirga luteola]MCI2265390.1 group 1 glycosyl transferase [Sediminivirga luteola]